MVRAISTCVHKCSSMYEYVKHTCILVCIYVCMHIYCIYSENTIPMCVGILTVSLFSQVGIVFTWGCNHGYNKGNEHGRDGRVCASRGDSSSAASKCCHLAHVSTVHSPQNLHEPWVKWGNWRLRAVWRLPPKVMSCVKTLCLCRELEIWKAQLPSWERILRSLRYSERLTLIQSAWAVTFSLNRSLSPSCSRTSPPT